MTDALNRTLTHLDPPAVHAQAALDGINADPGSFNMRSWMGLRDGAINREVELAPDQTPLSCGSTLCAAGWVVHNAGYTLVRRGGNSFARAEGGNAPQSIEFLAQKLLGLDYEQAIDLFQAGESSAKYALELIARGVPADWETDGSLTLHEWLWANGYGGKEGD